MKPKIRHPLYQGKLRKNMVISGEESMMNDHRLNSALPPGT
jgi:hypothetical protein